MGRLEETYWHSAFTPISDGGGGGGGGLEIFLCHATQDVANKLPVLPIDLLTDGAEVMDLFIGYLRWRKGNSGSKILIYQISSPLVLRTSHLMAGMYLVILVDPLVGSIATQYMTNREEHDRIAKEWTKRFAT